MQPSEILFSYARLLRQCPAAPQVAASPVSAGPPAADARPCALVMSPHPDDECLTGALPLRLKREQGWRIVNLAVTLGGDAARRAARRDELAKACAVLGFEVALAEGGGFSNVTAETRAASPEAWRGMAARVAAFIAHLGPRAVFLPHAGDAHPAHGGTHLLGMDALAMSDKNFACAVYETEYWQPHAAPNLMIGVDAEDAALLLSALACHAGENARNPFDVRFPAYLIDNVRRGSELVGGAGAAAAPMDFAMLYRRGLWRGGKFAPSALNRIVAAQGGLGDLVDG